VAFAFRISRVFSPLRMTGDPTARLTPALALDYLRQLSAGMQAAVVLDADGAPLAGDASLAAPARRLLAASPAAPVARERAADGALLLVARDEEGFAVAALAAPQALEPLLEHDLRTLVSDLRSVRMP
jgi:hypothetical protein